MTGWVQPACLACQSGEDDRVGEVCSLVEMTGWVSRDDNE